MGGDETARELWRYAQRRGALVVCLVRHGQTEWNASRRFLGRTDIGLDEVGRTQALSFARALPDRFTHVYSSPLLRARETAAALGQPFLEAPELVELHQGHLEGLEAASALTRFPDFFARWHQDP